MTATDLEKGMLAELTEAIMPHIDALPDPEPDQEPTRLQRIGDQIIRDGDHPIVFSVVMQIVEKMLDDTDYDDMDIVAVGRKLNANAQADWAG